MEWFETLPVECPPSDAIPCKGVYYRIAKGDPATSDDFFSQRKLQPYKIFEGNGVDECIARAVSLFKDKHDAQKRLKLPKFRHSVIAAITLGPKDGVMKKTFRNSHYSWWRSKGFDVKQAKMED